MTIQDTNRLQVEIVHALKPDGAGLVVTGDDAQAVSPFRAAAARQRARVCSSASRRPQKW